MEWNREQLAALAEVNRSVVFGSESLDAGGGALGSDTAVPQALRTLLSPFSYTALRHLPTVPPIPSSTARPPGSIAPTKRLVPIWILLFQRSIAPDLS